MITAKQVESSKSNDDGYNYVTKALVVVRPNYS